MGREYMNSTQIITKLIVIPIEKKYKTSIVLLMRSND